MTRVAKIAPEDWDPRLRAALKPEDRTEIEQGMIRFLAHCPDQVLGMMQFAGALKVHRQLPEKLVELVRLRVAFFNQCRSCMAIRYTDALEDGVTEDLVCSLERPQEAENLTPAEKAAIKFGEAFATDHLRIDEAMYASLREHFSESEIVELGMTCAFFVGFGRLAATLHMVEELPDAFRREGVVAPWGEERVVVR
ncbi:carboxymuconolactone decarboxylase family protein [Novosphingobium sp.]|uniref:carboxymuconolactone decarboxylase family protein n=1 Tax=Novosphingobium sp. TaxID=1874826 RepID=UPI001D30F74E|nr:carboxymuconolactone decarboxylase family protein [Novosphingobium sp.]MBX9662496.1 carboxymuconolactone decarboxylase family protein [Novosphingobium sp.]